jgi:hypothetical protein
MLPIPFIHDYPMVPLLSTVFIPDYTPDTAPIYLFLTIPLTPPRSVYP